MRASDQRPRAPADTFRPRRIGRLALQERNRSVTIAAEVIDVAVLGCELRVFAPVDADQSGRLGFEVRDTTVWIPVRTRSVRRGTRGWTVACVFERPNPEQQRSVYALMAERHGG